jgi:predicted metal-dependent enzyme (double-stranded beta helix superfamily)
MALRLEDPLPHETLLQSVVVSTPSQWKGSPMFDVDAFVGDCIAALDESRPQLAIKEILARAVSDPSGIGAVLPPVTAELAPIYSSEVLTIVKVVWAPAMSLPPHDHRMWAAIGIYGGAEDNAFWRRVPEGIISSGRKELETSEVLLLGADVIHSVTNPGTRSYTGAIHIYGGDFMNEPRSMWDPDSMREGPADGETVRQLFAEAEAKATEPERRI